MPAINGDSLGFIPRRRIRVGAVIRNAFNLNGRAACGGKRNIIGRKRGCGYLRAIYAQPVTVFQVFYVHLVGAVLQVGQHKCVVASAKHNGGTICRIGRGAQRGGCAIIQGKRGCAGKGAVIRKAGAGNIDGARQICGIAGCADNRPTRNVECASAAALIDVPQYNIGFINIERAPL